MADGWKKSKLSETKISSLVSRHLLQPRSIVQWQSAEGHIRPFEKVAEAILFKSFIERGLAIPICNFLRGLLFHWGIQLHHLIPNSILYVPIFVHLCEAFRRIHPHFDLFKSLFYLNPHPNIRNIARVGGAHLQLRPKMIDRYISYTPRRQIGEWKTEWFYIDNHAPAIPERVPSPPQQCSKWFAHGQNKEKEDELMPRIVALRNKGVTRVTVMLSWLRRQVQPLQSHYNLGFEYIGLTDPSRFSSEKIYEEEAMILVHNVLEGVNAIPKILQLYHVRYPPNQVII